MCDHLATLRVGHGRPESLHDDAAAIFDEHRRELLDRILRESVAEYVESARRVGGRMKRGTKTRSASNGTGTSEAGQIREWALANGFELAGRGRIPARVVDAYRQAKANGVKANAAKVEATKPVQARGSAKGRGRAKKR